jgi:hypothetical protein
VDPRARRRRQAVTGRLPHPNSRVSHPFLNVRRLVLPSGR